MKPIRIVSVAAARIGAITRPSRISWLGNVSKSHDGDIVMCVGSVAE